MDLYLFSDEAGDFTFNRQPNVSRYFIICTVTATTFEVGEALARLRHELIWERKQVGDCFHATTDVQEVRSGVYAVLAACDFQFRATICEKSKAQPQTRESKARFYKYPWFYHFKHGLAPHLGADNRLLLTAASIGTKKEKQTYTNALEDVIAQSARCKEWAVDFRPALAEPCLQVADYCAWAVQRKWERNDTRALDIIKGKMTYEYELWKRETTHYY